MRHQEEYLAVVIGITLELICEVADFPAWRFT